MSLENSTNREMQLQKISTPVRSPMNKNYEKMCIFQRKKLLMSYDVTNSSSVLDDMIK